METELLEFNNGNGDTLRGIFVSNSNKGTNALLMVAGFEGSATTQKKFKLLADNVKIPSFRFDYSGIGLSDGDFSKLTVNNLALDIKSAVDLLNRKGFSGLYLVCHSLAACAASLTAEYFDKIVLLAPALNQKDLLRYWFVKSQNDKRKFAELINWNNYKQYLNEEEFLKDCENTKITDMNEISPDYYMENKNANYCSRFKNIQEKIFLIHGLNDDIVPVESLTLNFNNKLLIDGDHDLERPDMISKWLEPAVKFLYE